MDLENRQGVSEAEVDEQWRRTEPLAKELVNLSPNTPEDDVKYWQIADHLKQNPQDSFQLFFQLCEQYPKPSGEAKANDAAIYQISHLVEKIIERSQEK